MPSQRKDWVLLWWVPGRVQPGTVPDPSDLASLDGKLLLSDVDAVEPEEEPVPGAGGLVSGLRFTLRFKLGRPAAVRNAGGLAVVRLEAETPALAQQYEACLSALHGSASATIG